MLRQTSKGNRTQAFPLTSPGALISVLCDGCGWGAPSRDAAATAKVGFLDYLRSRLGDIHNVQDAGRECLAALSAAQWAIVKDKGDRVRFLHFDVILILEFSRF